MSQQPNQNGNVKRALLHRITGGLVVGFPIAMFLAIPIYLLTGAVNQFIGTQIANPSYVTMLIFSAVLSTFVFREYSHWLDEVPNPSVLFRVAKGFIYGNTIGLYFAVSIYLLANAVQHIVGTLPASPGALAGLIWASIIMGGAGQEYYVWVYKKNFQ